MRNVSLLCAGALLALSSPAYSQSYGGQSYGGQSYGGQSYGGQWYPGQSYDPAQEFVDAWAASWFDLDLSIPAKGTRNAGFIVGARHIPAAPPTENTLPFPVHYLSSLRADELAIAADPGTYVFLDWAKRLAPRHGHGEDFRVRSCAGYVYKRWYEYGRFEDAARTCGTDAACVFAIGTTWSSPGISSRAQLFQKAPGIVTIPSPLRPRSEDPVAGAMWMPFEVKNDFFRVAPADVLRASTAYAIDPAFRADTDALIPAVGTPPLHDVTNKMQWHVAMAAAQEPLGLTRVERKEIGRRLARYRRLVDEYRQLRARLPDGEVPALPTGPSSGSGVVLGGSGWSSTVSFLGGSTDGTVTPAMVSTSPPPPLSPEIMTAIAYQAVVDEMAELLMYEWRHLDVWDASTVDHGCLVGISCDWSPELFAADYVGRFQSERESDMQRCIDATDGVIPGDAPWAADVVTMTAHIDASIAEMKRIVATLPFSVDHADAAARGSRNIHWGITPVKEAKGIRDLLHGEYEHHADADLAINFRGDKVCSLSASVDVGIRAAFTAPNPSNDYWPESHTIIDGKLKMLVARDDVAFSATAYLLIADHELLNPTMSIPTGGGSYTPPPETTHFDIYDYHVPFSILGVPAFLSVAIQGDLTFAPSIKVPAYDASCANDLRTSPEITPAIEGVVDSSVNVDADGRLGIGIPGFSFGVNGHIDVLTATLPASARFSVIAEGGVPKLMLSTKARIDAVLLGGSLSVYAEALFVYVEQTIFGWDGIPVGFKLWNNDVKLPLTFMADAFKPLPAPAAERGDAL